MNCCSGVSQFEEYCAENRIDISFEAIGWASGWQACKQGQCMSRVAARGAALRDWRSHTAPLRCTLCFDTAGNKYIRGSVTLVPFSHMLLPSSLPHHSELYDDPTDLRPIADPHLRMKARAIITQARRIWGCHAVWQLRSVAHQQRHPLLPLLSAGTGTA